MTIRTETNLSVDMKSKSEAYSEFFRTFDYDVTKASLSGAYEAPVEKWLSNDMLVERRRDGRIECLMALRSIETSEPIVDFTGEVKCKMNPGDLFIERIAFVHYADGAEELAVVLADNPSVLIELWEEKAECQLLVAEFGLKWLCTRILQTDELIGIYYHGQRQIDVQHSANDTMSICKLNIKPFDVHQCARSLERVPKYINHYSKYNKNNSWSAVSLRGYGGEADFISKPSEMSALWQKQNNEKLAWAIYDTPLREQLSDCEPLIAAIPGPKHRIRLMKLAPGGGEIQRHTDIQDSEAGTGPGKLMRIHIPIVTNSEVKFEFWSLRGVREEHQMAPGEAWYVDVRKPHRAGNFGKTDRIHLVVDVESNEGLKSLLSDEQLVRTLHT